MLFLPSSVLIDSESESLIRDVKYSSCSASFSIRKTVCVRLSFWNVCVFSVNLGIECALWCKSVGEVGCVG